MVLVLVVLMVFSVVACGKTDVNEEGSKKNSDVNGKFQISGDFVVDGKTYSLDGTTYSLDDIHRQLIDNGWKPNGTEKTTVLPRTQKCVKYYNEKYGAEEGDIYIRVYYFNNTEEELDSLACSVQIIEILKVDDGHYPNFGIPEGFSFATTLLEVEAVRLPDTQSRNSWYFFGEENARLSCLIVTFDDNDIINRISLHYR